MKNNKNIKNFFQIIEHAKEGTGDWGLGTENRRLETGDWGLA